MARVEAIKGMQAVFYELTLCSPVVGMESASMNRIGYNSRMRIVMYIVVLGMLSGCQSTAVKEPEPEEPDLAHLLSLQPHNQLLDKAELDVAIVQDSDSEWLVRDPSMAYSRIPLHELMWNARMDLEDLDIAEAERKARLISRMAHLALLQKASNSGITPIYPVPETGNTRP